MPSRAKKGYGTTCSRACHVATRLKQIERTCVRCEKPFMAAHYDVNVLGRGKFCSRKCKHAFYRKLRKRGEQEMFTEWQKREWKESCCKQCRSAEHLELDHIIPRFAGGKAERSNAQTLCGKCNRAKFWTFDYPYYLNLLKQRAKS